jgi:agmatine deiminase
MPGEFSRHKGTWMLWPERPDNWREGARPAQAAFVQVATAIAQFEPVTMGVSARQYQNARQMLPPSIRVVEIANNDSWMRDVGPTFVIHPNGNIRGVDWGFNAWGGLEGGLYFPWDQDDLVARKVLDMERVDRYRAPFILEGGSIHVDGEGTLLTTEECLLNPNRNPGMTKLEIETALREYTGVERILWLEKGIHLDETNGHVDNMACFLRPGVVAVAWTDNMDDPQYPISLEAYLRLSSMEDAKGRNLEVVKIPIPDPVHISKAEAAGVDSVDGTLPRKAGDRLAASYINFYFCNGGAIVPVFNDRYDELALSILRKALPDRKIVSVYAREILLGGGNIHCITQQQP